MFVVDTNLLLYAVNPRAADHDVAHALLEQWRAGDRPWFLTWGIVYEFLRVSTHPRVFSDPLDFPTAWEWLRILLECPFGSVLTETELHDQVLNDVMRMHPRLAGNVLHDLHTAVLMREHGIAEIMTADTDFHQFKFLDVVNPLRGG